MDVKWFKDQQKRAGKTAEDIARRAGRARSNVSHIYNGHQRMSLEWAQAFSDVLGVPLDEVLKRAGVLDEPTAQPLSPGFAESDAAPWTGAPGARTAIEDTARTLGGGKPGIDVWTVKSTALALNGYLPGDFILVDTHKSEQCKAGDAVIAQIYDWSSGKATTVLRRYEPPALVAASMDPGEQRIHIVDFNNVAIKGKIVGSWRRS